MIIIDINQWYLVSNLKTYNNLFTNWTGTVNMVKINLTLIFQILGLYKMINRKKSRLLLNCLINLNNNRYHSRNRNRNFSFKMILQGILDKFLIFMVVKKVLNFKEVCRFSNLSQDSRRGLID